MASASEISERILEAILAKKLARGCRLGEQQLADLFGCSRTIVREAMVRLETRGIVIVSARRGWFLAEPDAKQIGEAFTARLAIETGIIRQAAKPDPANLSIIADHLRLQEEAIKNNGLAWRTYLLGDFHVCLARCLGNQLLAGVLRDLTARTSLAASQFQSHEDASRSYAEHVEIYEALTRGDMEGAEAHMESHLRSWDQKLAMPLRDDPLDALREALTPVSAVAQGLHTRYSEGVTHPGHAPRKRKKEIS
jgi:DNA-binding GntR family transcriptional regulator